MKTQIRIYFFITVLVTLLPGCGKTHYWYVEPEFASAWEDFLRETSPPGHVREIRIWDGGELPAGPGILIAANPCQAPEKVTVYYRLPFELEHEGAVLLALDPWMVFRKHQDPPLSAGRAYSEAEGDGILLIPGSDNAVVQAWTARLVKESPGVFPANEQEWNIQQQSLFNGNRFPNGAATYGWNDVFFRLMGDEIAWVYAPLSAIRRYPNPQKSILEAIPFPEREGVSQSSLQASLLWALPLGNDKDKVKLAQEIQWLKTAETQTLIANSIEWLPADPYGIPYDPVSFVTHRHWVSASVVYVVNE